MKNIKLFLIVVFILSLTLSCGKRKEKRNSEPIFKEVIQKKSSFEISFYVNYPYDNLFMLWYNSIDGEENYNSNQFITKRIKGSTTRQEIVFKFDRETHLSKFRFRPVMDYTDNQVLTIDSIRITHGSKVLLIKPELYIKYFKFNKYVHWDSENRNIFFSKAKSDTGKVIFDPFIISKNELNEKLIFEL